MKMRDPFFCLFILLALLTGACSTTTGQGGPSDTGQNRPSVPTPPVSPDETLLNRLGTLPPQPLARGQCGLFLWARRPQRSLVLFINGSEQHARLRLDGALVNARRTAAAGDQVYGLFPEQIFVIEDLTIRLHFEAERRDGFTDGAVIPRATLSVEDATNWEVIMPAAGLIGCQ